MVTSEVILLFFCIHILQKRLNGVEFKGVSMEQTEKLDNDKLIQHVLIKAQIQQVLIIINNLIMISQQGNQQNKPSSGTNSDPKITRYKDVFLLLYLTLLPSWIKILGHEMWQNVKTEALKRARQKFIEYLRQKTKNQYNELPANVKEKLQIYAQSIMECSKKRLYSLGYCEARNISKNQEANTQLGKCKKIKKNQVKQKQSKKNEQTKERDILSSFLSRCKMRLAILYYSKLPYLMEQYQVTQIDDNVKTDAMYLAITDFSHLQNRNDDLDFTVAGHIRNNNATENFYNFMSITLNYKAEQLTDKKKNEILSHQSSLAEEERQKCIKLVAQVDYNYNSYLNSFGSSIGICNIGIIVTILAVFFLKMVIQLHKSQIIEAYGEYLVKALILPIIILLIIKCGTELKENIFRK